MSRFFQISCIQYVQLSKNVSINLFVWVSGNALHSCVRLQRLQTTKLFEIDTIDG
jgi:hypothetical protein